MKRGRCGTLRCAAEPRARARDLWARRGVDEAVDAGCTAEDGLTPHLPAPELAWKVHRGHRPLVVTSTDEVYTLAASLWWALTEQWPLAYEEAHVDPGAMDAGELLQAIATRGIPVRPATVWPAAQLVLSHVMSQPDYRRPSAADLAILLGTVLGDDPVAALS
ncbi:hypothetical protein ABZ479_41520 [Streptomyces sp. NPDC005722]